MGVSGTWILYVEVLIKITQILISNIASIALKEVVIISNIAVEKITLGHRALKISVD